MKNRLLFALVALLCCWAADVNASTLTGTEALQIVKDNRTVSGLSNTSVNFYLAEVDTIVNNYRCPVDLTTVTDPWVLDSSPKWLVFVDEEPLKGWTHNCSYYYVPKTTDSTIDIKKFRGCLPPGVQGTHMVERHTHAVQPTTSEIESFIRPRRAQSVESTIPTPNPMAQSTQVVLIGGKDSQDEVMRTYNDITAIYRLLVEVYGIPKDNIHVAIGTASGSYPDGGVCQLSNDLDGDGVDESVHPYCNHLDILDSIASNVSNTKHLFLFYGGAVHMEAVGGDFRDNVVYEILNRLNRIHPDILDMLCLCNGGEQFVYPGVCEKQIICYATAAGQQFEIPEGADVDPIVCHWVEGLNKYYPTGADTNTDGHISIEEVFNYTQSFSDNRNSLHISSFPEDYATGVTFDALPAFPVLSIRKVTDEQAAYVWQSPDIWFRNQDDGETNQTDECLTWSTSPKYLYVRIHNNGSESYSSNDKDLMLSFDPISLDRKLELCYDDFIHIPLNATISGNSSIIVKYPFYLQNIGSSSRNGLSSFSVMARIGNRDEDYEEENDYMHAFVLEDYNCVTYRKVTIADPYASTTTEDTSTPITLRLYKVASLPVTVGYNVSSIEIIPVTCSSQGNTNPYELSLELDEGLYDIWTQNGSVSTGFSSRQGRVFGVSAGGAVIQGLNCQTTGTINLKTRVRAMVTPPGNIEFAFHLVTKDENGKIIDGAYYDFMTEGYTGVIVVPGIGISSAEDGLMLSALNVNAPAAYSWYDENYEFLGDDENLTLGSEPACREVILLVECEDGCGIASVDLSRVNLIKSLGFGENAVSVQLMRPAAANTHIVLTSILDSTTRTFHIDQGCSSVQLTDLPAGQYAIALSVEGEIKCTHQFIKK